MLFNKNLEMLTEGRNDGQAENSIPPKLRLRGLREKSVTTIQTLAIKY